MGYFSLKTISLGFLSALAASLFIYLETLGIGMPYLRTIAALTAIGLWLSLPRKTLAWSGFFTALLWFFWIALSFRYYDLGWMMPLVWLFIASVYGTLFWLVGWAKPPLLRALLIGLAEFVHPLGFDWFKPALMFSGSLFSTNLAVFWILLALTALFITLKPAIRRYWLLLAALLLIQPAEIVPPPEMAIELAHTDLNQREKWRPDNRLSIVRSNLAAIDRAIAHQAACVVLPESAFPMVLNRSATLMHRLMEKSKTITIVTGALYMDAQKHHFNSTYLFSQGTVRIMHKVVLVPFGEFIPLPGALGRWVNTTFFGGASDFKTAPKVSDYFIDGTAFRNAICYEATTDRLYLGRPAHMIAMSNNAWFVPSVEPVLQKLLLQLQSDRHRTVIYHATNAPVTAVITPHRYLSWIEQLF